MQHVLFWASFVFIISYISFKTYPLPFAILRVSFVSLINVALYIFCYHILVNRFIEKHKFLQFMLIIISLLLISTALRYNFDKGIASHRIHYGFEPFRNRFLLMGVSFFTQAAVMLIACLLSISANRFITESKLLAAAKRQNELELTMLKTKISPHFLLNTLNNIYYYSQFPHHNISNAILKLSYLLQYVSYEMSSNRIALEREIEIIKAFNDLFAMRFEEQLDIKINIVSDEIKGYEILPGILVTLFENALKHSGIGINKTAWIKVDIQNSNEVFKAKIGNSTFSDKVSNSTFYSGIGLKSVREMLHLAYGDQHNLIVHQNTNFFEVTLTLNQ